MGSSSPELELGEIALEFDCLVNDAGITMKKRFLEVQQRQFGPLLDVNLRSPS